MIFPSLAAAFMDSHFGFRALILNCSIARANPFSLAHAVAGCFSIAGHFLTHCPSFCAQNPWFCARLFGDLFSLLLFFPPMCFL